ncbi:hypothetical protein ACFFGV_05345 [Pontibacillus salicampi]|uniref:Uncharacterized protein n=1 Tax=Pontibacillus salicampi TaxID=1449801 RepID=A0ABV6LL60_9BACI
MTVIDEHGSSDTKVKEVDVLNLRPTADWDVNPNPTNRLTNTSFREKASDPEGDALEFH